MSLYDLVCFEDSSAERVELVRGAGAGPLDLAIAAWLDAKRGRSGSAATAIAYESAIAEARAQLGAVGLDLDGEPRAVALVLQRWAGQRRGAGAVAPATYNQRLAIVSSFYTFARRRGLIAVDNPAALVERRPVQSYAGAEALRPADVRRRMAAIDRAELAGRRDYALLTIALSTGRRVAEIAGMRWAHVHLDGDRVRLNFPRTKGGKTIADVLPAPVARALLAYLAELYGQALGDLPSDAPIWPRLDRAGQRWAAATGYNPLSARSLENICRAQLGINFHGLRHTFARSMEDTGAKVSDIQSRLGHSSLQTTGRYLAALHQTENPHGEQLAALLGLGE